MKKIILPIIATLALSLAGVGIFKLSQVSAYTPPPSDYSGQDVAFWMWLSGTGPNPVQPYQLTSPIFCPRIEAVSGNLILMSWWHKLPSGKVIWAQAQGFHFTGWAGWVILVTGPRYWLRVMTDLVNAQHLDVGTGAAGVAGPYQVEEIQDWGPVCNWIANRFLIRLSFDSGIAKSPYTEAGSWPDQESLTCENGVKYQLKTSMNGLPLSMMGWTTLPPAESWQEAPSGPSGLLPCSSGPWNAPDAALYKSCNKVPIGTPCP